MRVTSSRPLASDEEIDFDLPDHAMRISGRARVVRQQRMNVYVLRFENLPRRWSGACTRSRSTGAVSPAGRPRPSGGQTRCGPQGRGPARVLR